MRFKGFKPARIAVAFLVALAVLAGGAYAWRLASRDRPLSQSLREVPGVRSVRLEGAGARGLLIYVNLGPVADLRETYTTLEDRAGTVLGDTPFDLRIQDNHTPALMDAYHRLHFALQEGLETGRFADMGSRVDREVGLLRAEGTALDRYRVWVDDRHLYVELHQGRNALYEVVPRPQAAAVEGGGEG